MPWECREGRAKPMDLDNQISRSQTARLEPITHSRDVTWAGGSVPASSTPQSCCSFLTSFGNFSHKSLSGSRELLQQILLEPWSQHGGQEGQEAQGSWFQSRSLPAQAVWFTLPLSQSKNSLSVFASSDPHPALPPREFTALGCKCPGILCRSPCSKSGTFQLLTGAVSPCRATSSSWGRGGQAGSASGTARPGGHPEVGVSLAGAHICTDVPCAPRGISPKCCPWPVPAVLPDLDAGDTQPAQG